VTGVWIGSPVLACLPVCIIIIIIIINLEYFLLAMRFEKCTKHASTVSFVC
jgi:hypothetical protein